MMTRDVRLMAVIALAACASSPPDVPQMPAPTALDPAGTFEYSTTFEGMDVNGSIVVASTAEGHAGVINTGGMTDPIPFNQVLVDGQTMRLLADTPDGTLEFRLNFVGDTFTGRWTLSGSSGAVAGRRAR